MTVQPDRGPIVSIMSGGASAMQFSLAESVARDLPEFPLFVIFKGNAWTFRTKSVK